MDPVVNLSSSGQLDPLPPVGCAHQRWTAPPTGRHVVLVGVSGAEVTSLRGTRLVFDQVGLEADIRRGNERSLAWREKRKGARPIVLADAFDHEFRSVRDVSGHHVESFVRESEDGLIYEETHVDVTDPAVVEKIEAGYVGTFSKGFIPAKVEQDEDGLTHVLDSIPDHYVITDRPADDNAQLIAVLSKRVKDLDYVMLSDERRTSDAAKRSNTADPDEGDADGLDMKPEVIDTPEDGKAPTGYVLVENLCVLKDSNAHKNVQALVEKLSKPKEKETAEGDKKKKEEEEKLSAPKTPDADVIKLYNKQLEELSSRVKANEEILLAQKVDGILDGFAKQGKLAPAMRPKFRELMIGSSKDELAKFSAALDSLPVDERLKTQVVETPPGAQAAPGQDGPVLKEEDLSSMFPARNVEAAKKQVEALAKKQKAAADGGEA